MSSISNTSQISSVIANTSDLPTEELEYSLSMGDEHLSTILETKLDKVIKSSVKNLVPIPSKCEVTSVNDRIEEADFDLEEEIHLVENFFDSQIEETDLFLSTDDLMPRGIENNDYDSEEDINFLEEFLSDDTLPLPENKSSNFDHHDNPSFLRPPLEPLDVEIFSDFELDMGVLTAKMVEDISEHQVLMPKVLPSQPILCSNIDTLLPFSSKNEDKVFKLAILSYLLVSHRDKITFDFS
nr:hypothetical protein [Tanacetum cinerariifolium]